MYKPEVLITQKRKEISTRSQANAMFWWIPRSAALESMTSDFRKQRHVRTSGFGYCFYFRFVPDAVLRSRILSACPIKQPQLLRSPSHRFASQSNNYFRYPSAILEFLDEGSGGWVWHIHQWRACPQNIGIATEIASISVSIVKLLVLPVWGTVSTSDLCPTLFSKALQCCYWWKWIERALKHCRSRWDHFDIVSCGKVITTSGICRPSWSFWAKKALAYTPVNKLVPQNIGRATEIASISVSVVKLLVLPVWGTVSTSDLYLMLFSKVGRCWYLWKWIGHDRKLCRSRWLHVDISSRHQLITTSGFRPSSCICKCRKCQTPLS